MQVFTFVPLALIMLSNCLPLPVLGKDLMANPLLADAEGITHYDVKNIKPRHDLIKHSQGGEIISISNSLSLKKSIKKTKEGILSDKEKTYPFGQRSKETKALFKSKVDSGSLMKAVGWPLKSSMLQWAPIKFVNGILKKIESERR